MANIKKKLENLKPGKEYLVSVKAKNVDLNIHSDFSETLRFEVPKDSTIPGQLTAPILN